MLIIIPESSILGVLLGSGYTSEDLLQVPTSGNFLDLLPGFTSEKVVYAIFSFRAPEIFQNCLMDKAAMP